MIVLFTDFGLDDPYVGQMKAALLHRGKREVPIVDLLHGVPNFNARAGAHLLAALQASFPEGTVFVAVVDPGVGSARRAVVVEADGRFYVGPDNGLLAVVAARAQIAHTWQIRWRPQRLSASFHGRDLFAPIAARIAAGDWPAEALEECGGLQHELPASDLAEVIYIDHYGNAMTGLRATALARDRRLRVGSVRLAAAEVFADMPPAQPFWYANSCGLVEIAVNRGSAAAMLSLAVGTRVEAGA